MSVLNHVRHKGRVRNSHMADVCCLGCTGGPEKISQRRVFGESDLADLSTDGSHCESTTCTALSARYLVHKSRCRPSNPAKNSGGKPSHAHLHSSRPHIMCRPFRKAEAIQGKPGFKSTFSRPKGRWLEHARGAKCCCCTSPTDWLPEMEARLKGPPIRTVPTCWDRLSQMPPCTDTC